MHISADQVKALRDKTGAGMMECKRALHENGGDAERATEWLRKQGLAVAAKKSRRTADDGMIGLAVNREETQVVLVEVNCETDFVVKTPDFQRFVGDVADLVARTRPADLDALLQARLTNNGTVAEVQTNMMARIGEHISVRRFVVRQVAGNGERLAWYVHAGSKIGVAATFADPAGALAPVAAKDIAMHVAAMHPLYLRRDSVPADLVGKEQEIQRAQMAGEKKPPDILEKIVTGRLNKYFAEVCLEEQIFVKDPEGKRSVAQVLQAIHPAIRVIDMVRFQVGEK